MRERGCQKAALFATRDAGVSLHKDIRAFMEILVKNRFTIFFTLVMVSIAGVSFIADLFFYDECNWFQRAGALIVLAGAGLQYSSISNNWKKASHREQKMLNLQNKISVGKGISLSDLYDKLEKTRNFSVEIHEIITEKSFKQVIAIILIVTGTVIWAYGDIPFK